MILRFFAYNDSLPEYKNQGLGKFLNFYMRKHQNPSLEFINQHRELFLKTVDLVILKMPSLLTERMSNVLLEAILFGVSKNIHSLTNASAKNVYTAYCNMKDSVAFSSTQIQEGLANPKKLSERLGVAQSTFQL